MKRLLLISPLSRRSLMGNGFFFRMPCLGLLKVAALTPADWEVVIVDEFTGRLMQGRRYSEGLHEAIEAKEGIRVQSESQTFATITIQNYFRLYPKLAGMTGTAAPKPKSS
jgi:hypothetical protein